MPPYTEKQLQDLKRNQERLANLVIMEDRPAFRGGSVTGIDVTYSEGVAAVCAVTINSDTRQTTRIEKQVVEDKSVYIPGFFYLKEGPIIKRILEDLEETGPVLIDANGVLHPRGLGMASQIGVELDIQTIGIAKKLHTGSISQRMGDNAHVVGNSQEIIGQAVWCPKKKRPYIISIGHRISLKTAAKVMRKVSNEYGPIPLRLADRYSREVIAEIKRGE
ncbi:MAG: hypothetical protein GF411_17285 [Candidatus Lokiarchaeota archaeon]|nr:hypothetical protein [Candidatus Lokiarchaeota archaeon]